jgi:hypothetical protein
MRLADNGLRGSGHHGRAGLIEGRAAIDMVLHHHDGNEHDGGRDSTENKSHDSEAATVGHDPLPKLPLTRFVASALTLVQGLGLTEG